MSKLSLAGELTSLAHAARMGVRAPECAIGQTVPMRAAIARNRVLVVEDIADPVPGPGDALVR